MERITLKQNKEQRMNAIKKNIQRLDACIQQLNDWIKGNSLHKDFEEKARERNWRRQQRSIQLYKLNNLINGKPLLGRANEIQSVSELIQTNGGKQ